MLSVALPKGSQVRSVVVTTSPGAPGVPYSGATSLDARQVVPPRSGGGGAAKAVAVEQTSMDAAASAAQGADIMRVSTPIETWGGPQPGRHPAGLRFVHCATDSDFSPITASR